MRRHSQIAACVVSQVSFVYIHTCKPVCTSKSLSTCAPHSMHTSIRTHTSTSTRSHIQKSATHRHPILHAGYSAYMHAYEYSAYMHPVHTCMHMNILHTCIHMNIVHTCIHMNIVHTSTHTHPYIRAGICKPTPTTPSALHSQRLTNVSRTVPRSAFFMLPYM